MEKYTILREVSIMSQKGMRLREDKSNKIIAEVHIEPLNVRISVFFVAIFIAFTEYMRVNFGENFIPARPFVAFGVILAIIWQFTSRGWDLFLYDPIVNRISHNGKINRRGLSGYQIMDKSKKKRYNLVIKTSSGRDAGNTSFKLVENQLNQQYFDLESSTDGNYMAIRCHAGEAHVFNTRFKNNVNLREEDTVTKETQIGLEVSNPTDRMLSFVVSTLIIFKFQSFNA